MDGDEACREEWIEDRGAGMQCDLGLRTAGCTPSSSSSSQMQWNLKWDCQNVVSSQRCSYK